MLLLIMELRGRFNSKMIKKAKFGDVYFDEMGGFESVEQDRVTGNVRHAAYISGFYSNAADLIGCREEGAHLQTYPRSAGSVDATSLGQG
jgi:hypothetical protein